MGQKTPEGSVMQFCTEGDLRDVITCAKFDIDRLRGLGVAGGRISGFPIDLLVDYYNTLTLPCECVIEHHQKLTSKYHFFRSKLKHVRLQL